MSEAIRFVPSDQDIKDYENLKQELLRDLRKGNYKKQKKQQQ
jgi:hypothetical protein